jgi:hypothetical protein
MRVSNLLVEVRDANLNRVGQIPDEYLVGFTCVLRSNEVGTWKVVLPYGHAMQTALSTPGAGLVVTYNGTVLLSGPTVKTTITQTTDDLQGTAEITGCDDSILLQDRLAYPTPTSSDVTLQTVAYDVRTGAAETVMKSYVEANIGPLAPAARKVSNLTIEGNFGRGATVKGSARFDVLYDLLNQLADASLAAGTTIGFDVRQSGTSLVFECYTPTNRTSTVRLDIANDLLTETTYSVQRPKFTRAIVGGQGDGTARAFLEQSNTASLAAETSWGRRIEAFVDARDAADSTSLQTAGNSALSTDGKAIVSAAVKPTDDSTMLFGVDWYLGDTVTVVVGSYELAAVVNEVGLLVSADGVRLYGTVGEPKQQTYEAQIQALAEDLDYRLNNLERYK